MSKAWLVSTGALSIVWAALPELGHPASIVSEVCHQSSSMCVSYVSLPSLLLDGRSTKTQLSSANSHTRFSAAVASAGAARAAEPGHCRSPHPHLPHARAPLLVPQIRSKYCIIPSVLFHVNPHPGHPACGRVALASVPLGAAPAAERHVAHLARDSPHLITMHAEEKGGSGLGLLFGCAVLYALEVPPTTPSALLSNKTFTYLFLAQLAATDRPALLSAAAGVVRVDDVIYRVGVTPVCSLQPWSTGISSSTWWRPPPWHPGRSRTWGAISSTLVRLCVACSVIVVAAMMGCRARGGRPPTMLDQQICAAVFMSLTTHSGSSCPTCHRAANHVRRATSAFHVNVLW